MSNITETSYSAYDSASDRDDQILAIREAEGVSLAKATKIRTEIAKERGDSASRNCITDSMYAFLAEGEKTEAEFKAWVEENGTANTLRWFKHHDKVRQLTNELHSRLSS